MTSSASLPQALQQNQNRQKLEFNISRLAFASGCFAGACGIVVGHPLDTLKVRVQTGIDRGPLNLRSLYSGVFTPLITAGCIQALNLGNLHPCTYTHAIVSIYIHIFFTHIYNQTRTL